MVKEMYSSREPSADLLFMWGAPTEGQREDTWQETHEQADTGEALKDKT